MEFSAGDVKKLRDETDAPLMECKAALKEAEGDYTRAKEILREKGKAAAAKRADRKTKAGVALLAVSDDHKTAGGVVLESETDFVAKNEEFIAIAQKIAEAFLATDPGSDPLAVKAGDTTVGGLVEEAIAKIRENIRVAKAVRLTTDASIATYIHHDKTKASAIELEGDAATLLEVGHKLAIQSVAFPPEFVDKAEIPQDYIDHQVQIETKRAIEEGKKEEIAKNIAVGRVNKEIIKNVVLLEQPFYADLGKSVADYVSEQAKAGNGSIKVRGFTLLTVGQS
jgi:elongation factor Ts